MSDREAQRLLGELAEWLGQEPFEPDEHFLPDWLAAWREAVAGADRGQDWPALVARAQELAGLLRLRMGPLAQRRGRILQELQLQTQGRRALKGYQTGAQRV